MAVLLGLLVLGGPGLPAHAEDPPSFEQRVERAIGKGVAWLRTQQRKDGAFPGLGEDRADARSYHLMDVGLNALVVLTLAHGGANADDDAVKKTMRFCEGHYRGDPRKGSWNLAGDGKLTVYVAATLILALDALHDATGGEPPEPRRDRYGAPQAPKPCRCRYPKRVERWIRELVTFLARAQDPSGGWRYPGNPIASEEATTDLSNTQYALLGLAAAARCGIEVAPDVWRRAAEHVVREQEEDGLDAPFLIENAAWSEGAEGIERFVPAGQGKSRGWCYLPGHVALPTGAMTAAGVTSLAVAKDRLWHLGALEPALGARIDVALRDGLIWLGEHFDVTRNPEPSGAAALWQYYWLYGVERAGAKVGVRFLGRHDWYRVGAEYLLAAQGADGSWPQAGADGRPADHTESAITQTCFAVLFLRRATARPPIPMTPTVTGGGDR
jgi:hypothetical protein